MKTLAHISDLHFGAELSGAAADLRADLARAAPDLIIVSGDLTQRARTAQFAAARTYLDTLPPAPRLVVPGNHDVPLYDVVRRFLAPLGRYRRHIAEELDPVLDDGELFVAGINTARSLTWKSGRISLSQIETLRRRLSATRAPHRIVVTHHPFIPPPVGDASSDKARIELVGRAAWALTVLDAGHVDLLLSGHLHHSYAGDTRTHYPAAHRAIVAAQAGTAISRRVRHGEPNGYNLITLDGDSMRIEVRVWRPGGFAPAARMEYRRSESGWAAGAPEASPWRRRAAC